MEMWLLLCDFIVVEQLILVDIVLVVYICVVDEGGFDLDEFFNVCGWVVCVESEFGIDVNDGCFDLIG